MQISISGKRFWSASGSRVPGDRTSGPNDLVTLSPSDRMLVRQILFERPFNGSTASLPLLQDREWKAVARAGRAHGLVPILYDSLVRGERLGRLPPDVAESLGQGSFRTELENWLAFAGLEQILSWFEREQIPVVLLKGAALAHTVYTDPGLRPMADLDLLVQRAAFPRARAILIERNYEPILESGDGFDWHFSHAQGFSGQGARPLFVELHWHLFGLPYYRERIPIDWFWNRTTTARLGKTTVQVFSPEAQIVHLAAHMVLHHQHYHHRPLVWSYDLALVLSQWREQIRWDQVIESAGAFGLSEVLRSALALVEQVWGVSIPDQTRTLLDANVSMRERLLSAAITAKRVEARDVWDGLQMRGLKNKLGYFRQVLFPSIEYMRTRYQIADPRSLPLCYLVRLGRGVVLFCRSGLSMAGSVARALARSWLQDRAQ